MRNKIAKVLDYIFINLLSRALNLYERIIMYRIREAWGLAHTKRIKNKGTNVKLIGYSRILNPENLEIGSNVRIGYGAFLFCKGGIKIGNNCIISRNVTIYSANHNYESDALPYDNTYTNKKVVIEDNVWIGMNVMITPGVTIKEGSIIAMGSVVTKDVESHSIVASTKQFIIKKRDVGRYRKNVNAKKYFAREWPNS